MPNTCPVTSVYDIIWLGCCFANEFGFIWFSINKQKTRVAFFSWLRSSWTPFINIWQFWMIILASTFCDTNWRHINQMDVTHWVCTCVCVFIGCIEFVRFYFSWIEIWPIFATKHIFIWSNLDWQKSWAFWGEEKKRITFWWYHF